MHLAKSSFLFLLGILATVCLSSVAPRESFDGHGPYDEKDLHSTETEHVSRASERKLQYALTSPAQCDYALYTTWKDSAYDGMLVNDPTFWRYQTQLQFQLSKGLALELAVAKCTDRFKLLYAFKAGRTGPVDIQNVWKAMCSDECIQSDIMHQDAMDSTGCSCLELSTNSSMSSFRKDGDWCLHNSARLLCDQIGFCGIWGCRIDDFMCPRYEWNKKIIPIKGPGHCDREAYKLKLAASAPSSWKFNSLTVGVVTFLCSLILSTIGELWS